MRSFLPGLVPPDPLREQSQDVMILLHQLHGDGNAADAGLIAREP